MLTIAVFLLGVALQVDQGTLAQALQSETFQDRYQAVQDALKIPPDQRDEVLWLALVREMVRVREESHQGLDLIESGRGAEVERRGEAYGEYHLSLIEAVSQWRDPRALKPLILAAASGNTANLAIVGFGEVAVPLLIDAARNGHFSETGGVLYTLQLLLEGRPGNIPPGPIPPTALSRASKEQIVIVAREMLRPGRFWTRVTSAARLALATGNDELRQEVELLAHDFGRLAADYGIPPIQIETVQRQLQRSLDQHSR